MLAKRGGPTLEAQDKSTELQLINDQLNLGSQEQDLMELAPVNRAPGEKTIVQQLRDLCSQIRGSAKQRDLFIQARNKTRDPKLLPINIPMTRWNYFLKQIQWANQLKLSIQIYTSSRQIMKYQISDEAWSAMEYMEPILSMFEKICNIFQSNAPTKHLVLPYYQGLLTRLGHYASVSPHTWRQACEAAYAKLNKYCEIKLRNDNSLIEAFLNPKYQESIFKQIAIPLVRSKRIIDKLCHECATLNAHVNSEEEHLDAKLRSDKMSDAEIFDLLNHLQQIPIETTSEKIYFQYDEVGTYLQNLNPMIRGEQVIGYWKVSNWITSSAFNEADFHVQCQILSGHFPNLGIIAFTYLSIPLSSACVECVFSHSGCLKSPTRASLGSRTISHLTCLKEWLNNYFPNF
ncbi:hypothetical protein O181_059638 [Austropuccinia psidii MF-1]|uniref:HAT C-terminal dimerisation domain-containing protein n=1 Tax=Austropuccinia psidii MF-1 TaxID=1389203 RepID=A0A9Q3HWP7_9BASI|nr:hypothetical protein [Austropuccinia psidii MF-1]